jgi:drug/metabolite transporter (DMT)-like permease
MNVSGGSWLWSSSLRYIFMLPILLTIMIIKNQLFDVLNDIIEKPIQWIMWSTVGFGLFYAPLSFASIYGASWLVAGTWQITIIAGALMSPLFFRTIETKNGNYKVRNEIPKKSILISAIILLGIFLMQYVEAENIFSSKTLLGIVPVILAAFAYPLGNRKMIEVCDNKFNTFQRVFGMTLCSIPFWILISIAGVLSVGLPSNGQILHSLIVAVFSGIIATILFFKATDIVSHDTHKLAVIESTQSGEVIFTLLGGVLIFHDKFPSLIGLIGIILVVTGMILNNLIDS